ncbi:hypothetical protein Zm00014a_022527 [Zea mays]|jgi:hypothetical protein|uniref:Uncharacterized protein n=1 Tax=Zea mays TaxID=4577 RepID=A0A3L6D8W4_MAIZE|nr:hypothetical protein Zm00014a_022527 [Zea mays]
MLISKVEVSPARQAVITERAPMMGMEVPLQPFPLPTLLYILLFLIFLLLSNHSPYSAPL